MRFLLKVTPRIDIELRHQLEDILEDYGYKITDAGQTVDVPPDESFSDILFEGE